MTSYTEKNSYKSLLQLKFKETLQTSLGFGIKAPHQISVSPKEPIIQLNPNAFKGFVKQVALHKNCTLSLRNFINEGRRIPLLGALCLVPLLQEDLYSWLLSWFYQKRKKKGSWFQFPLLNISVSYIKKLHFMNFTCCLVANILYCNLMVLNQSTFMLAASIKSCIVLFVF